MTATAAVFAALLVGLVATAIAANSARRQALLKEQALRRAESGERQALRAATAAGVAVLLPEADARRLAEGWQRDIASMRSERGPDDLEACRSEAQFTVWMVGWLLPRQQADEADQLVEQVYPRCRSLLATADPTRMALCNARIRVNEARGGPPSTPPR